MFLRAEKAVLYLKWGLHRKEKHIGLAINVTVILSHCNPMFDLCLFSLTYEV